MNNFKAMRDFLGDYHGENPECKETHISFYITGFQLNPKEVTKVCKIKPTKLYIKGDKLPTGDGKRSYSLWMISTEGLMQSTSTEKHAQYILKMLKGKEKILRKYIDDSRFRTNITVWWESIDGHGGFTLRSETISNLSRYCNDLDFFFV